MLTYERYKHLIGLPYVDGKQDCYGLVRRFYADLIGMVITNYARPVGFDHSGLPGLITDNFLREGFVPHQDYKLQVGDGLLFYVASKHVNHLGVYVGNGQFLHHLHQKKSSLDPLDDRWRRRLSLQVRHPDVTEYLAQHKEAVSMLAHLPPHLRHHLDGGLS